MSSSAASCPRRSAPTGGEHEREPDRDAQLQCLCDAVELRKVPSASGAMAVLALPIAPRTLRSCPLLDILLLVRFRDEELHAVDAVATEGAIFADHSSK